LETWATSLPRSQLARPKASKKLLAARAIGLAAVIAFTFLGLTSPSSLDVPWDGPSGNERFGFYQNGLPTRWICDEGHEHYSLPFWAGAVACAVPTALWWLVWPRKRVG
jgi:hypothetical protein